MARAQTVAQCWADLDAAKLQEENAWVAHLLTLAEPLAALESQVQQRAAGWIEATRQHSGELPLLDAFLREFELASREGIALIALAEALLRIPDPSVADRLIAEQLSLGDWQRHLGHSPNLWVNAGSWGLRWGAWTVTAQTDLAPLLRRLGEPLLRQALKRAVALLGQQYVLGSDVAGALKRISGWQEPWRLSLDCLGEGARSPAMADSYRQAYQQGLMTLAEQAPGVGHSLSIKLSALHPRFEPRQRLRLQRELLPVLQALACQAREAGVALTLDAEEADRLTLTLELFEALSAAPDLSGWEGLGLAVQAYQKRALAVIDWLHALAQARQQRYCVRLVKGAYWDSELKLAQQLGLSDYPVLTQKAATDLSYEVCSLRLLHASPWLYPQFASHNARTLAWVSCWAESLGQPFELQRLQGMGELLYRQIPWTQAPQRRLYAPVGEAQALLPYLVRRLMENGANRAFVHQYLDPQCSVEQLVQPPREQLTPAATRQRRLAVPGMLPASATEAQPRQQCPGIDLAEPSNQQRWQHALLEGVEPSLWRSLESHEAISVAAAVQAAQQAWPVWNQTPVAERCQRIDALEQQLHQARDTLLLLLVDEAGKTLPDALAEWREAIDLLTYYRLQAAAELATVQTLPAPVGESNRRYWLGYGVFACISPWNFPLAIFLGQIAAALLAGNTVVAKSAPQTPRIARFCEQLWRRAGLAPPQLTLLSGAATEGAELIAQPGLGGVAFTGAHATALGIRRALAEGDRPWLPLIVEAGGLNAMVVDSSAQLEQVVDDLLSSAFNGAGQRCSSVRLVLVDEQIAQPLLDLLRGALSALRVGDPHSLDTDVGPLISAEAASRVRDYIDRFVQRGHLLASGEPSPALPAALRDRLVMPTVLELHTLEGWNEEVFGPVLHWLSYTPEQLPALLSALAAKGYGLTLGVHSRLQQTREWVRQCMPAGNVYFNRNTIGAVVGWQPFGGVGRSGSGQQAGGPDYLRAFARAQTVSENTLPTGGGLWAFNGRGPTD